jgi:ABC-type branched-subunit amino acid transport system permease subunit
MIIQQLLNGLIVGGVYALFAIGFTLVFGIHQILNLAHGAVFMTGAFVALYSVLAGLSPAAQAGRGRVWRHHFRHRGEPDLDHGGAEDLGHANHALPL